MWHARSERPSVQSQYHAEVKSRKIVHPPETVGYRTNEMHERNDLYDHMQHKFFPRQDTWMIGQMHHVGYYHILHMSPDWYVGQRQQGPVSI